jgi:hypothetical protein
VLFYLVDPSSSVGPRSKENWGIVTHSWTRHQSWWTSVPDRATDWLAITDRTPLFDIIIMASDFIFCIIITSSSYLASFFTDVTGLVMCSIWEDHPMTSIFILYILVSRMWVTGLSLKNPSHPALIGCYFHPLVISANLNGCKTGWMHLLQA